MQVDENMVTAQQRDAALSKKFYFRKNVFPPGHNSPCSSAGSSGTSSPCCASRPKEKKLRNCFPALQLPEAGMNYAPVKEEYEEMTMNEIINGKVRLRSLRVFPNIFVYFFQG
jgi:glutamate--cysteine ligase catalytic subunit